MNFRKFINHILLLFILVATPLKSLADAVPPNELCKSESMVVGFFNGVWNTEAEAILATSVLEKMIGSEIDGKNVEYETFYNHTGSSVDATRRKEALKRFTEIRQNKS